jgi:hypothetical protein
MLIMCFYDSILIFVGFLTHHINLRNIFVDVLRIGVCPSIIVTGDLSLFFTRQPS